MKTKLVLAAPLLRRGNRPERAAIAIVRSTAELERDIKENIQRSRAAGKTYRKTAIVRSASRKRSGLNLKERADGKLIVGYNFHRASKRGQPPAIDSGRLINSIRGIRVSQFRGRIIVGAEYGLPLDDPDGLDRPFFTSRVELYRPRYFENIRRALIT